MNSIKETVETNLGTVYLPNCDRTQFFNVGDYVATFDQSKFTFEEMYKMNKYELAKTDCVKAKVTELFESYFLIGGRGNNRNLIHHDKMCIQYQNGETLTIHPNFHLIIGKF